MLSKLAHLGSVGGFEGVTLTELPLTTMRCGREAHYFFEILSCIKAYLVFEVKILFFLMNY